MAQAFAHCSHRSIAASTRAYGFLWTDRFLRLVAIQSPRFLRSNHMPMLQTHSARVESRDCVLTYLDHDFFGPLFNICNITCQTAALRRGETRKEKTLSGPCLCTKLVMDRHPHTLPYVEKYFIYVPLSQMITCLSGVIFM